jgi:hypothetical protein
MNAIDSFAESENHLASTKYAAVFSKSIFALCLAFTMAGILMQHYRPELFAKVFLWCYAFIY